MSAPRRLLAPVLLCTAALMLGACQQSRHEGTAATDAPDAKPGTAISHGRLVLPAVKGNPAAAYFRLDNTGPAPVTLVAVSIAGAATAEAHRTAGGAMEPVGQLPVPAGSAAEFAPGGLHVMVFRLDPALQAGGTAEMTLTFADGDKITAPLAIMTAADAAAGGMHH